MNKLKGLTVALMAGVVALSAGCSEQFLAKETNSADGAEYMITAEPQTLLDRHGNACSSADGVVFVTEQDVSGEVKDTRGRRYSLSGKRNAQGQVKAGLAYSHRNVAGWTGEISGEKGNGRWQDQTGCRGYWQAIRL